MTLVNMCWEWRHLNFVPFLFHMKEKEILTISQDKHYILSVTLETTISTCAASVLNYRLLLMTSCKHNLLCMF